MNGYNPHEIGSYQWAYVCKIGLVFKMLSLIDLKLVLFDGYKMDVDD
jgi:hypothetical protein